MDTLHPVDSIIPHPPTHTHTGSKCDRATMALGEVNGGLRPSVVTVSIHGPDAGRLLTTCRSGAVRHESASLNSFHDWEREDTDLEISRREDEAGMRRGVRGLEFVGAGLPLVLISAVLSLSDHPDSQQVRLKVAALSEGKEQQSIPRVSKCAVTQVCHAWSRLR